MQRNNKQHTLKSTTNYTITQVLCAFRFGSDRQTEYHVDFCTALAMSLLNKYLFSVRARLDRLDQRFANDDKWLTRLGVWALG